MATLRELWSGRQQPTPLTRIPIVIGGTGPKTVAMVADYADWWNVPLHLLDQLDARRGDAGEARVSVQLMVGYLRDERDRDEVSAKVAQRWGRMREGGGVVIGTASELIDQFGAWRERGVERIYTWFSDFAAPETLAAFGADVIRAS